MMNVSDIYWEYEDELPEMEDVDFDRIFEASRVIGNEYGGIRMYPYVEDNDGNRIWLAELPDASTVITR